MQTYIFTVADVQDAAAVLRKRVIGLVAPDDPIEDVTESVRVTK